MELEIVDTIDKQDEDAIYQGLREYNRTWLGEIPSRKLGIYLRDEDGGIVAGLTGDTRGNWLYIQYLWVSDMLRGQGVGTGLVARAKQEAIERGCCLALVDTFDFQAPEFYKKLGFRERMVLEQYPVTGKRHYLTAELK